MSSSQRAVIIGGVNSGIVSTGDSATNVQVSSGRFDAPETVEAPQHLMNIPLSSYIFVGRDAELAALDQEVTSGDLTVVVVHGLGGSGKSNPSRKISSDSRAGLSGDLVAYC